MGKTEIPLDLLLRGESCAVVRCQQGKSRARLLGLGFLPNARIEVIFSGRYGMVVKIFAARVAISRIAATAIIVTRI